MTVALLASAVACLGTTSPSTVNFNPTASAEMIVVAVGWSSAPGAISPPLVTFDGEIMDQVVSPVAHDTSTGALTIYTLPVSNPANASIPVTFTQQVFNGNMQVAIFAYSGTSQILGVIVTDEYGTNPSPIDTGTTSIPGITAGSVTTFVGMTFFSGTPAAIDASGGWTDAGQSTASNEGVYTFTNTASGTLSMTVTPDPDQEFNMLVIAFEVLAGTPVSGFTGVNLVASAAHCFGVISSSVPGTLTFDPTSSADFLVVTVGWASSSPLTPPSVTFGTDVMQIVTSPLEVDNGFGAVALYALALSSPTSQTVTVNSTPNFAGLTSISLAAYSGSSQQLGVMVIDEYGTNPVPVTIGNTALNGVSPGSSLAFVVCSFFGHVPTDMYRSSGWDRMGDDNATNQSIFSYHNIYRTGGNFDITLRAAPTEFNFLAIGYEVVVVGTPHPFSEVEITATQISYLGEIGLNPTSVTFDANGASVLCLCAARTNSVAVPATFTFAGLLFSFIPNPSINDPSLGGGAAMDIAILANPPAGSQTLTGEGPSGYIGDTVIQIVGLKHLSGVAGVRASFSGSGTSSTINSLTSGATSLMLAFVASPFTKNDQQANYGWDLVTEDKTGVNIFSWLFQAVGASDRNLYLINPAFADTQALVLEFVHALPTTLYDNTDQTRTSSYPAAGGTIAASFTTPPGTTGFTISDIKLMLKSTGGSGGITVFLYSDSATAPDSSLATVATINDSTLTSTFTLVDMPVSIDLVQSTRYWIVVTDNAVPSHPTTVSWGVTNTVGGQFVILEWFEVSSLTHPNFYNNALQYHDTTNPNGGDGAFIMQITGQVIATRGGGERVMPTLTRGGAGDWLGILTPPDGMELKIYFDTWLDVPDKDPLLYEPDDFYLSRIPSYITTVMLSFAIPQFTYVDDTSNIKATTGLNFPGSVTLFKATLALLRQRNPDIKILVAIQQNTVEASHNIPYQTTFNWGWSGMTSDHVASINKFLTDCGMDGIVIDYEVLDAVIQTGAHHCVYDADGNATCYTDAEQVFVIKTLRQGLPHPFRIYLYGQHVGSYFQYYYRCKPVGFNSGYNQCITHDSDALAALDGFDIGTYDAGNLYDPRSAVRAYQEKFPGKQLYIGCRVGSVQYQDVKITCQQFRDFANYCIMLGLNGAHFYSYLWDTAQYPGVNNPHLDDPPAPFGNYVPDFPDANLGVAQVAEIFNLGNNNLPNGQGYDGRPVKNLRLVNSKLAKGYRGLLTF